MPRLTLRNAGSNQHGRPFVTLHDRLLVAVLLFVVGADVCCATKKTPMFPTCPTPTTEMVDELEDGALDDAPAIEEFLGRVENMCDALESYD